MKRYAIMGTFVVALSGVMVAPAWAQTSAGEQLKAYREALAEGNPAELYEMEGEELWVKPMGPKKASLDTCNLGLGPGVVKGASAQLPRYFKDTNKVQDLESRLMTCMLNIQGIPESETIDAPWGKGQKKVMAAIVAYVVTQSKGMKVDVPANLPQEKKMVALGEKLFYQQGGPMDFSCASCHSVDNQRIRMQDLPNITKAKGAQAGWGSWPAYRVGNGQFWTMQHRINDCYRQQRMPFPIYGSDVTIALSIYMANKANGGEIITPGLKR
ncbi:MAG: sulfur oxidation c-type cytochrome SoxA [Burkholderiaceae bacterium]|jgi:L-cysteine S-thiosulfotransferase|nr:sulfur oxidation c-type cytochrome SoxA [Burkholderiaceae bacterium]